MALNRLLSLISTAGVEPQLGALSRWTEITDPKTWEAEPLYGAFVDDAGLVVTGSAPCRAFVTSHEPIRIDFAPEALRKLNQTTVVFVDWGRQPLGWPEIFELWAIWEEQDKIADCGSVGVPWDLAGRWVSPGWIAFRGDFDGSPLSTVTQKTPEVLSFLARAQQLRGLETTTLEDSALPMLPFTVDDLSDPTRSWPEGVVESSHP